MGERLLVIDSATEACSIALFEYDTAAIATLTMIAGSYVEPGRGHAERLVPMIAALPGRGRAARIMVNLGPGSFTGIRVGLAAARALGLAWGAPVGGYGCLDLVAAQARLACAADQTGGTEPIDIVMSGGIDIVMSGGHGEWFFQPFGADGVAMAPFVSLNPDAVIARAAARHVAGTQAEAVAARNGAKAWTIRPDARAFGLLSPGLWRTDTGPVYGRAPDAKLPQSSLTQSNPTLQGIQTLAQSA